LKNSPPARKNQRQCDAKAIFRLLNYCPPGQDIAPVEVETDKDKARYDSRKARILAK